MNPGQSILHLQYSLVRQSREVLFDYCRGIPGKDLLNENSSFGRGGSVRNLLVHIANCYEFWIAKSALKKEVVFTAYPSKNTMADIEAVFASVDKEVLEFIDRYASRELESIQVSINGTEKSSTALEVFTHVITHEFHHKGQILSLTRHLGYVPADTDIMR